MVDLFKNELLKLKRSKSVKVLFWFFVAYSAFAAVSYAGANESYVMQYGFSAPFLAFGIYGASGFFFYAAIAGGLVANEFSQGTIHNALSCGVNRRNFFLAKTCSLLGITLFLYLSNVLVHCIVKNVFCSFDPYHLRYPRYWVKVLIFNLAAALLTLSYMSLFICIGYLCRKGVMTFVVSTLVTLLDTICYPRISRGRTVGPGSVMWKMLDIVRTDSTLNPLLEADFFLMLIPSLCMGVISLAAAYQIFKRADIN